MLPCVRLLCKGIFILCFVVLTKSTFAQENEPSSPILRAELSRRVHNGISQLYGELNIGDVRAGERCEVECVLINTSSQAVKIGVVKPSCACAEFKVRSGTLGDKEELPCRFSVEIRPAIGEGVVVASVELLEQRNAELPVATVQVRANVWRPFLLTSTRWSITTNESGDFTRDIPFTFGKGVRADDLEIKCSNDALSVQVEKRSEHEGALLIRGQGLDLESDRVCSIELAYSQGSYTMKEQLTLDFFARQPVRVLPTAVSFDAAKSCRLKLFSRELELVSDDISAVDENGFDLEVEAKQVSASLVTVCLKVTNESIPRAITLKYKDFSFPVSVLSN